MTTKLDQYKAALRAIGDQRLGPNGLTENHAGRRVLDDVWDESVAYMLRQASWKFALRVVQLDVDADVTLQFGQALPYSIPTDFVRLAGIALDPDFTVEIPDYDEHDGHWWIVGGGVIYLRYTSNDAHYGLDLGKWPVEFSKAHAIYLAAQSGLQITKSGATKQALEAEHMRTLHRAKSLDAIGDAVKRKPMGTWTRSRLSRGQAGRLRGF